MIGYVITFIIISIIVSIITEQMLIRRLQLSEGVEISRGRCILKPGYGQLPNAPVIATESISVPSASLAKFYKTLRD